MLRRALRIAAVSAAALSLAVSAAWAQGRIDEIAPTGPADARVALVIGNSSYKVVNPLTNPANDPQAIGQTLNRAGFEVVTALNMNQADMRRLASDFAARVAAKGPNTVALVFYAGHGLQVEGENFLVPVDARIQRETDVGEQTMPLADLMKTLQDVNSRTRIFILDACRNNPFPGLEAHGLALADAPADTLLAYSTAPGAEAVDGSGQHSPYADALLKFIKEPGVPIEQMFKQVRLQVHQQTQGKQTPWESSSLTSNFAFFSPPNPAAAGAEPSVAVAPTESSTAIKPLPTLRVEELKSRPAEQAYWYVIAEDSDDSMRNSSSSTQSIPSVVIRFVGCSAVAKRCSTGARQCVNTSAAYEAYLSRHPRSDHEVTALRLRTNPRARSLNPIFAPRPNNDARHWQVNANRQQLVNAEGISAATLNGW